MGFKAGSDRQVQDASQYVAVAASQTTAQISRAGAAAGDYLDRLVIIPASTGAAGITLLDGTTAVLTSASAGVTNCQPYTVSLGITATSSKGFVITTGASVAVIAVGRFDH